MQNTFRTNNTYNLPRRKTLYVLLLSALSGMPFMAHAAAAVAVPSTGADASAPGGEVEFESGFMLQGSSKAVDLSRFEKGNVVLPGTYSVDLYVNSLWIGRADMPFKLAEHAPANANALACFDRQALTLAGVDVAKLSPEVQSKLDESDACLTIDQAVDGSSGTFDFGEQRLDLSIPQVSLKRAPRGYVSPEHWEQGVDASFLNYNANVFRYKTNGSSGSTTTSGYLGLTGGLNVDVWHLRHNGAYTWSSKGHQKYQSIASYVQRDIPSWTSQLIIGESSTSGELFDSVNFRGVRIATDDRMLPDSMRGYAPTVRGVANSNAKVTITQNGMTIYETTVAPGSFEINDLYATGYGGDLTVTVTEADGSIHTYNVPYAAVPLSLRPGVNRYSVTAGTLRMANSNDPVFAQATWQHGFSNLVTGYAGANAAEGYGAVMGGAVLNTKLGAFGLDYTQAATRIPGQGRMDGGSTRVSYSKDVVETGSNIAVAAYRYSTGGFYDLVTAAQARDMDRRLPGSDSTSVWRMRNRASVTFSQQLGSGSGGQLALSASTVDYWNRSGSDVDFSLGYNNNFRSIGYSVQATRQRNANGRMDTQYYASATIPLGETRPMSLSTGITHAGGQNALQSSLSGTTGQNNSLSYGISANHSSGGGNSNTGGSANVTYRDSHAEFNGSIGAGNGYSQGSLGVSGAIVAHPGGISLSQPVSETFGIVQAPGAEGAQVLNQPGLKIDGNGYAVVPYLTPYSANTVMIDPKGISTDVELQSTSQQVAPHAGSVVMIPFATEVGRSAVIKALQADGSALPFGADVLDESGKVIGVVGQASKILARGLNDKGQLTVKWSDAAPTECRIDYELPAREKGRKADSYQQIKATCVAGQWHSPVAVKAAGQGSQSTALASEG